MPDSAPAATVETDAYQERGYVVVRDALPQHLLQQLRDITDEIVSSAHGLTEHSEILDLEPEHRPDAPRVRRIKRPHLAHPFFRDLAADPHITNCLTPLIGPDIRLRAGGKVNMKSPGYGAPVEWHQDWAFYPHTNQDVLAVGVLLDDMNADNGPLLVLPGSHHGEVFDHHSDGNFCGAIDVDAAGVDVSAPTPIYGRAGDMTIHHARLVHGSAQNTSQQPRRILFFEYAAADAWPLAGVEALRDLSEFDSRIVCGRPTLQPRLESVPVRVPLPIAVHQGSIYENQRTLATKYFS